MLGHVVGGSVIVESDVIVGELLSVHFGILGMEAFAEQCRKCGRRWDGRLARRCAPLARSVGGASSRSRIRESLSAQQRASSAGPALCRRHPSRLRQFSRECGTDRCSRGFPARGDAGCTAPKHIRLFAVREDCYDLPFAPSSNPARKAGERQAEAVEFRRSRAARRGGRTRLFAW